MTEPVQSTNKLVPIMVVLLVIASFFVGSLYTKVNLLEKNSSGSAPGIAGAKDPAAGVQAGGAAEVPVEPTPVPLDVDLTKGVVLGSKDAKVALVEFTDYQCPFCGRLFTSTFP